MGYKLLVEILMSETDAQLVSKYKIDIPKLCCESLIEELKTRRDLELSTRFHDDRKMISALQHENEHLRQTLDRKSNPIIHLNVRRDSAWRNAQEGDGLETKQQVHKPVIPVLRR